MFFILCILVFYFSQLVFIQEIDRIILKNKHLIRF